MQLIDSIISSENLKIGIVAIAVFLLVLWVMKIAREVHANMQRVRINKRKNKEGKSTSWKAVIRIKGYPSVCKSFERKQEAEDWAQITVTCHQKLIHDIVY